MLIITYVYKLIPTSDQIALIEKTLETCRLVWNYALKERKDWLNSRKCNINSCSIKHEYIISPDAPYPEYNTQAKRLTEEPKIYTITNRNSFSSLTTNFKNFR